MHKPTPVRCVGRVRNRGCSVPDCTRKHEQFGLCRFHWRKSEEYQARKRQKWKEDPRWRAVQIERSVRHVSKNRKDPVKGPKTREYFKNRYWSDRDNRLEAMLFRYSGMSQEMAAECRKSQKGLCAICPRSIGDRGKSPNVENRDHFETLSGRRVRQKTKSSTKHPRGLLCGPCNVSLGYYELYQRPLGLKIGVYETYIESHCTIHFEEP